MAEPGRRIVKEEIAGDGTALPWVDMKAFASRAIEVAQSDLESAEKHDGLVFFDRGLIDAAVALDHSGGQSVTETLGEFRPYSKHVFVAPPWIEIFARDASRRHSFSSAVEEYHRIVHALEDLSYRIIELPPLPVRERAELVLRECDKFMR